MSGDLPTAGDLPGVGDLPMVDDLERLTGLVVERPGLFLRYSTGPETDMRERTSRDYEADVEMPGLSVTTIAPEPWWPRPARDWVARRICKYGELGEVGDRVPWLLTGRVVGYGPDHEPLVADVRPVARIGDTAVRQAEAHYREWFHAGQDSRG